MRIRGVRVGLFVVLVCALSLVAEEDGRAILTPWPPDAYSQYKLYMIGNAHIDIPWLWPWPEAVLIIEATESAIILGQIAVARGKAARREASGMRP